VIALDQSSCHSFSICILLACVSRFSYLNARCFASSLGGVADAITSMAACETILYAEAVMIDILRYTASNFF